MCILENGFLAMSTNGVTRSYNALNRGECCSYSIFFSVLFNAIRQLDSVRRHHMLTHNDECANVQKRIGSER